MSKRQERQERIERRGEGTEEIKGKECKGKKRKEEGRLKS